MRRSRVFLVAFFCGAAILSFAQFRGAGAAEELDPPIVCKDPQKLVLENQFVRLVERVPSGVSQGKHRHRRGVGVALSDYTNEEINYPSREKVRRKAGDAGCRHASVHESSNVGISERHRMRIEFKY